MARKYLNIFYMQPLNKQGHNRSEQNHGLVFADHFLGNLLPTFLFFKKYMFKNMHIVIIYSIFSFVHSLHLLMQVLLRLRKTLYLKKTKFFFAPAQKLHLFSNGSLIHTHTR